MSNRTDTNGECTIYGVSKGTHTLIASKTGYKTATQKINVDASQLDVKIKLDKDGGQGFDVHMTVVDEQKQPIQGATVELDGDSRTTGSAGGCNFQNISEGEHTIIASKTGYDTVKNDINVDASHLDFDITLNKEETGTKNITFQLKDEEGNNISLYNGTNLELLDPKTPTSAVYTGLINENGQATIHDIELKQYILSLPAIPDEYRGLERFFDVDTDTSENQDLTVPFNLSDITFKITDNETKQVITGATVKCGDLTGVTDDKGLCTFKDLHRGHLLVEVTHKFYQIGTSSVNVRKTETIPIPLTKDTTKYSVSIHVHDGDVNIHGASVTLNNTTETTDVNGNCAFMDILAGEYQVKVSASGYEPKEENVEFYHEHITADIVLEVNTTNVTIEVKESGGATRVQNAIVNLNNENKLTDEKGKCTFEKVQYGDYPLRIFKEGYKTIVTNINVHKDMSVWAEEKLRAGDSITLTAKNKPIYEEEVLEITGQLNGQLSSTKVMNFQFGTIRRSAILDNNRVVYKYIASDAGLIPVTAQYNSEVDSNVLYIHDGDLPRTNVIIKPIDEVTKEPLHYATSWLINQDGWEIDGDYQTGGNEADTVTIENVICGNYNLKVHHGEHKEKIIPLVVEKDMGITTVELTPNSNKNKGE